MKTLDSILTIEFCFDEPNEMSVHIQGCKEVQPAIKDIHESIAPLLTQITEKVITELGNHKEEILKVCIEELAAIGIDGVYPL